MEQAFVEMIKGINLVDDNKVLQETFNRDSIAFVGAKMARNSKDVIT